MIRAGIVLLTDLGVAAIERVRDGITYYVLPGGQVDEGESVVEAAVREAHEELGVLVKIRGLVGVVNFGRSTQHYFWADPVGGEFGTGTGEEMASPAASERGSYRAVQVERRQLAVRDVRPQSIAVALAAAAEPERLLEGWLRAPLVVDEM